MKPESKHSRQHLASARSTSSPLGDKTAVLTTAFVASALFAFVIPSHLEANNGTWTGDGSSASWNDADNWGGEVPGAVGTSANTGTATFNSATGAEAPIIIDANRNLRSLFYTAGAGSFTVGSTDGNALYLTSSTASNGIRINTDATSAQTINAPLILSPANATAPGNFFIVNNSTTGLATFTLNGGISAAGGSSGISNLSLGGSGLSGTNVINGIISDGDGIVSLTNTSNASWVLSGSNSYSGGTKISGAMLGITHSNALGSGLVSIGGGYGLSNSGDSRLDVANAFELSGSADLRGDLTISGPVSLLGSSKSNLTIGPTADTEVVISGVISGASETSGFTKQGEGTLTLSGANTFEGGVSVTKGVINVHHSKALGTGKVFLSLGGSLGNSSGSSITIANSVDINPGTQVFNLGSDLVIAGELTTNNAGTPARTLTVEGATLEFSGNMTTGIRSSLTYIKNGGGGLTLSGSNSFTAFQFTEGTLNINHSHALSSGTFSIRLAGDKYLDNTSGSAITIATGNAISIESGFTFRGSNDLDLGTGTTAISNYTITVLDKTLTTGGLSGASGRTITKAGPGTWAISGSSTLPNSAMTILGGALRLSHSDAITGIGATGGVVRLIMDGGVVELTGDSGDFNRALGTGYHQFQIRANGGGFSAYGADAIVNIGGAGASQTWGGGSWSDEAKLIFSSKTATHTVDFKNGINLKNSTGDVVREIYVENGSGRVDAKISGALSNSEGTAGIIKTGTGTLELTGANTYNGLTTVAAGTLLVNGSLSSALGAHVEAGATLGGRGSVAKVSGAGTLSPGNSGGIISIGEIDGAQGLGFHFEFTAPTIGGVSTPTFSDAANSGNDVIRLTGGTPFSGDLTLNNTIAIDFTGTTANLGDIFLGGFFGDSDFAHSIANANFIYLGLDEAYALHISTVGITADFIGGPQNGFITQFEVIPEPSTTLFVLSGGVVALGFLSRKRKATKC